MSKTPSFMVPLGTQAPIFNLQNVVDNQWYKLGTNPNSIATVIMFICNHCPFVKHINSELTRLANDYLPKNIEFIAINSNDVENYPQDSPDNMKITAQEQQYPFPYLFDENQTVAEAYHAACTPDFFIFDSNFKLIYRGQLDDSRPGNTIPVTGESVREVLEAVIHQQPIPKVQKPSLGCNIKWKP